MTDPGNPTNTDPSTGSPSSSGPPTGEPSNPPRWAAPGYSRFAGRTPEEILGIAEAQAAVLEKFNQPTPPPAQPQPNRFDLDLPDDEYLTGRQVKGILQQVAQQRPTADPMVAAKNAKTAWTLAEMKFPDEFKRWGQEIWQEAQKLPIDYWDVDNLAAIVKLVRGNHVDELAAEKAQRLVNESHPTIRSGTGGSGGVPQTQRTLADDNLPKGWVEQAKAKGITEATVLEFCQITGQTPEQYLASVEAYGKGAVIRG